MFVLSTDAWKEVEKKKKKKCTLAGIKIRNYLPAHIIDISFCVNLTQHQIGISMS